METERPNAFSRVHVPVPAWGSGERHAMEKNERVSYEVSHWEDLQVLIRANECKTPVQVFDLGKLSGADLSLNNNYWVYINFPLCYFYHRRVDHRCL